jgi:3-phenylpropionate/cinnamic acid dioxygenase small subunit
MTADDYFAIQNLLFRYCDLLDRGDLDGMASLFAHANVYVPADPVPIRNAARIAELYRQYTRIYPDTGTPKTRHVTTNVMIEPEGDTQARAQSYVIVFQATETLRLQPVIGGRNYDRFERVEGRWRFSERRIESDLLGDLSEHMLQAIPPSPHGSKR